MSAPAYGVLRQVSATASVLLENNPSSMTLEGTNSWVLRATPSSPAVVVDPGYRDLEHLELLAGIGAVELILLTHCHPDHAEGAPWFAERVGAPVRAFDPSLCVGTSSFVDGEEISAGGLSLRVLHTPGHTDDSVSLVLDGQVLTGDTILGRGTTVLHDLGDYLRSLRKLIELPPGTAGLPGHGPELPDLPTTAREYLAHREQRLDQVRSALKTLGADATPRQVVEVVYADVDRALWAPAEWSVQAQLDYLRSEENG
ncbi:beta-lactamase class B [Amycolatopsis mediterranei S699]|uniref:Beta-lactamase class B n=2 Tax=Amycolatopsis mediterranei TaxID=33910 RepID=A0A0H3DLF1_AMYMU|nr:MBL fold metallo-hydrolase [Amycolatopsis mediterranei]ADJ50534.1 beta-lactamase class B [Amycolatopsis mediterranei U32]AEK47540.1 beta-lactamase class B [Amycolatopsis mediterranei S699]AFO82240.1 beta-lactamase class B [Amycolatopsis mediterranei S699]AGT89369.1 beta-lactamase class B [Amycolatopsis mediterranei RB]KDO09281.1 beta-lactamase [Amycolatopsis mediterranei]